MKTPTDEEDPSALAESPVPPMNHDPDEQKHQPKKANSVDGHVGGRIKARRIMLGMSQGTLAESLGVTFQQVQKYEKGRNRIGAGRLYQISRLLGVDISYFFKYLPEESSEETLNEPGDYPPDVFASREASELLSAYFRMPKRQVRMHILSLCKAICTPRNTEN